MSIMEISYELEGEKHTIKTGNEALGDIVIDNTGIPPERRLGTSRLLMASGAIMCFTGTLIEAMESRDLKFKSIKAKAYIHEGKNNNNVDRITQIDIAVELDMQDDNPKELDRLNKIMKNGCYITSSMHEGIEMKYKINDKELN